MQWLHFHLLSFYYSSDTGLEEYLEIIAEMSPLGVEGFTLFLLQRVEGFFLHRLQQWISTYSSAGGGSRVGKYHHRISINSVHRSFQKFWENTNIWLSNVGITYHSFTSTKGALRLPTTRLWRVPATRPDPNFYFATRTRPELFLKSSEFRVLSNRLFPSRLLQIF